MAIEIRRLVTIVDEIRAEFGHDLGVPIHLGVAALVIRNPLAGRFEQSLVGLRDEYSAALGSILGDAATELVRAHGGSVEAYGKGAIVGLNGEVEHGSVIIHTPQFTSRFKSLHGGETPMPSAEKRGAPGCAIDLALKHRADMAVRSHHMTYEVRVADAPLPDEIVVILAYSTGGRPHARAPEG